MVVWEYKEKIKRIDVEFVMDQIMLNVKVRISTSQF